MLRIKVSGRRIATPSTPAVPIMPRTCVFGFYGTTTVNSPDMVTATNAVTADRDGPQVGKAMSGFGRRNVHKPRWLWQQPGA
jgi:hypothetical protein